MTPDDVRRALNFCDVYLKKGRLDHPEGRRYERHSIKPAPIDTIEHAIWMIKETYTFLDEGKIEKAMRWLGFIQCILWSTGRCTIEQLKTMNRGVE